MEKADVVVIGAGVIGLTAARALAEAGREVIVVDTEKFIGSVTTSRNSGIIHAGIYYPTNSNKARLCVEGKKLLYTYAKERNIPYNNCGKLIVASSEKEIEKLKALQQQGQDNGITDLRLISGNEAMQMEPELSCLAALVSPSTGIIDIHHFMQELQKDIEDHGGVIALQNTITGGEVTDKGIVLSSGNESICANVVINAAGPGAQSLAQHIKGLPPETIPKQYLAKGSYFSVSGTAPFSKLVYPVPVPGGLGTHFTMNIAGESLFGPNVEWLPEQDYRTVDYNVDPAQADRFREDIKLYWPGVESRTLNPAYAGVRPKIVPPGAPNGDFIIQSKKEHGVRGLINLYGIESPGLTASLAIAGEVVRLLK
jgi:L-2-hydroxyglutarate oxidase LhgO